jgi:hypothetical protein
VFEPDWPSTPQFACHNGGGCPTYPKLWSVRSKRKVDCNRLTCCATQPKEHSLGRHWFAKSSDNHCSDAMTMTKGIALSVRPHGARTSKSCALDAISTGSDKGFVATIRRGGKCEQTQA